MDSLNPGFVRPENQSAVAAALDWGLARCRGDAARALFPPLVILLGELNVTVLPVDRGEAGAAAVDFRVTFSRPAEDGRAVRVRFAVADGIELPPPPPDGDDTAAPDQIHYLPVDEQSCRERPWQTAGAVVGSMLAIVAAKH